MTKENENQKEQDNKLLDFAPKFLSVLHAHHLDRITDAHHFFTDAFVLLTDHDLFEEVDFRLQWTGYLSYFENLSKTMEGYTSSEVETAIRTAILILEKRKEEYNAN